MRWNENLSTGSEELDSQIKKLIDNMDLAIVKVIKSKNEISNKLPLGELIKCFKEYFEAQEKLMDSVDYPQAVQHKYHHEQFMKKLEEFNDIMFIDNINSNISQIRTYATQWIVKHIAMQDKEFAKCYLKNKEKQ